MLLAECSKNEVRMGDGQEVSLGLAAFGRSLAPHAARAHRNERLADLVTGPLRIIVRADEAGKRCV